MRRRVSSLTADDASNFKCQRRASLKRRPPTLLVANKQSLELSYRSPRGKEDQILCLAVS